jgi:cytochrome c-type biogenesis protein CcmH
MKRLLGILALAASLGAWGQSAEVANPDPKVEGRLKAIAHELRCLVCQNQTIADSNAPLAIDLRQQARTMIAEGRSDDEIRRYMVDRYGDFVLYKPPFNATTAVLWVGPGLLIVVGFGVMFVMLRRRRAAGAAQPAPDAARRREIEALLASEDDPSAARKAAPKT